MAGIVTTNYSASQDFGLGLLSSMTELFSAASMNTGASSLLPLFVLGNIRLLSCPIECYVESTMLKM